MEMEFFDAFPKAVREAMNAVDGKVHCLDVYNMLDEGQSISKVIQFIHAESQRWLREEKRLYDQG